MERTLILLKPDAVTQGVLGKVIARFEEAGFKIRACKMVNLSSALLREHYAHHADKPYYPEIEDFMQQTPVMALILEGENVIARVREMLGATDSKTAAPGTIRAEWGSKKENSKMFNIAHASDSPEAAVIEIKRFFQTEEIVDY